MNIEKLKKKQYVKNIKTLEQYITYRDSIHLTDEQKLLFDCVFLNGYDYSFIADTVLFCSVSTVKRKINKILQKL